MPVDKFGRNCDFVYTGINTASITNSFVRRDGGNTAIGAIDMNSYIITNVADPSSKQLRNLDFCWVRHKCAIIFLTRFTIKSSYQDTN